MQLLLTGAWQDAKENIFRLEQMGHAVRFLQYEQDPLPCPYDWVEGVVCNGLFLHHPIEEFKNLRYIQLTSAGFDRVDMNYVQSHGIEIHNARGVYSIPMAEFAISGVLQLYKQSRFFSENQKSHRWEKHRGLQELSGKTVCIIGCGDVGRECAKRFAAFGCHVIGVNRTVREESYMERVYALTELDKVLPIADVVVLAIPSTQDTARLMNEERLAHMKNGAVLVNVARGALIDTNALVAQADRLGGAVLDVFEEEPLPENSPLWEMKKVILTPHNSFVGDGNRERLNRIIMENFG